MAHRLLRQLKSIDAMKRLEDQRLELAAQRQANLSQQLGEIDAEIDRLEADVTSQLETASIELAPYLNAFVRAARGQVQRLQARKSQVSREASEQEQALRAIFKKVRMLELAEARNLQKAKKSIEAADAALALEALLRGQAQGR